ncbi:MAG: hypothetical protein R3B90_20450 [Planctomycetaceae bacterium]
MPDGKTLSSMDIVAALTKVVQEQEYELEAARQRQAELEIRLQATEALEARLKALEAKLAEPTTAN